MNSFKTICHNNKFSKIVNLNGRKVIDTSYLSLKTTDGEHIRVVEGKEYDVTIAENDGIKYFVISEPYIDSDGSITQASVTLLDSTIEIIGKHTERNFMSFFYTPDQLRDSKINTLLT
jgi:hypothetical protein